MVNYVIIPLFYVMMSIFYMMSALFYVMRADFYVIMILLKEKARLRLIFEAVYLFYSRLYPNLSEIRPPERVH
jgi:hypothetical protein